jgi:uncharacterized integral membrane protein (TIGR00697 family)
MKIQKFDLLVAIYICCVAISELMGAKSVPLFTIGHLHLTASVALLVVPLIYTINDMIIEVYGRERARSLVFSGLVVVVLLLLMSLLATSLPPTPRFAGHEAAYDTIFRQSARIAAASLIAFAAAELLDVWVFSKIREKMGAKALWFRNNVSNFAAQLVDTVIFISVAFYAFGKPFDANFGFLVGLIIPYWLLKCMMSVIETPLVYAGVKWLRDDMRRGKATN